ncbi:MAG: response regulator, partial [Gammaproteobacteria bacterium]|nr:response regulator [Gammaproteobacteria bacterium]
FAQWADGPRLFAHLRDLPGPLRLADLPDYVHERGFSPELMRSNTLQSMPMHHQGEHLGNFFLAEKASAEVFSADDEELLALFASQAAAAIVNARAHRNEQRARMRVEALVETSPVAVAVFDAPSGRLVSFNNEARRLAARLGTSGQPVEELLGAVTCRFADGSEVALADLPMASAATLRAEEILVSAPDGRTVRTLANVTPIRSNDGTVVSVVVYLQDLEPLEELERLRVEFLAMVGDELRAPLASIKGSTATVLGGPAELPRAEILQFLRIVDAQADHMRRLIVNLLDAGRIEAGTLSVDPEPSALATLVDRARNTFASGGARHAVRIDLPRDLPQVMADRERIVQVLNNLLANAARNSPESSPIVVEAARDGVHVAVSVIDRGRGLSPHTMRHPFRKHVSFADDGAADRFGPTELGLAICKGLVEAHGGRIRAESAGSGRGTRFTFTLPVAAPEAVATAPPPSNAHPSAAAPEKPRVLVVDDDPSTLRHVRVALARAGYTALTTGNPDEIAGLIRSERPHLVLLDLVLPGVDGIDLMERVPELSDLPVIFISAYGRDETIARAFEAGAADYIVKPFSPTELTARVGAELRRRAGPEPFVLGDLTIDYRRRTATVAGRAVPLTRTEYELVRILSVNAGGTVTSESLLRQAWGTREPEGNTERVRAFVKQIRAKLGDDAANPTYIFNEHGVGYRMPRPSDA